MDIFLQKDIKKLLNNKKVVFIGDSNIRALYKDVLCLLSKTMFISQKNLKAKNENSCFGDKLMTNGPKTNGRNYKEERKAELNGCNVSFFFITRVYDSYVQEILDHLSKKSSKSPDVIIINSCLWDVTRWGPGGVDSYKTNLKTLMKELKKLMPDCLVIWVTAPPIACELKGGFLVKELEFLRYSIRFHVMEANHYARKIVVENGFDVVDSHYHLKLQIHRRSDDGIHWKPDAVRYVTNLLLSHISLAWNVALPHRYKPENESLDLVIGQTLENNSTKENSSATITKPTNTSKSTENKDDERWEKENCDIKEQSKNKSGKKRKHDVQESHHAYLSKVQKQERHKRIRKWRPSFLRDAPTNTFSNSFTPQINCSNYNQNDSGYFSSPHQPQFSPVVPTFSPTTQMYVSSPRRIPLPQDPYPYRRHILSTPGPVYNNHTPVQMDLPYKRHASMYATNLPFSNGPYPNYHINGGNSQPMCSASYNQDPYDFSNVNQQPMIDFTSSETMPFGLQF